MERKIFRTPGNHFKVFFCVVLFFFCTRQVKALLIFMLTEVITVLKLAFCSFSFNIIFFAIAFCSCYDDGDINKKGLKHNPPAEHMPWIFIRNRWVKNWYKLCLAVINCFSFSREERKKRLHNDNMLNISTPHVNLLTLYLEREDEEEMAKFLFVKFVVFIHNTAQHYAM